MLKYIILVSPFKRHDDLNIKIHPLIFQKRRTSKSNNINNFIVYTFFSLLLNN